MIKNLWLIIGCINSIAMAENIPEPGLATPAYTQPTITYSQPVYTQPTITYSQPIYTQPTITYSQPIYTQPTITYSQPIYTQPTQSYYTTQTTNYATTRYRYPMVTSKLGYPNYQTINFNYGTRYLRRR
jgi:hypothetical protein